MTIELTDAQEMHRQHPVKFEVPTKAELDAIKPGDSVQAGFGAETGHERMWILVRSVEGDWITGELNSYPTAVPMTYGDKIKIEKRHVSVWVPKDVA